MGLLGAEAELLLGLERSKKVSAHSTRVTQETHQLLWSRGQTLPAFRR